MKSKGKRKHKPATEALSRDRDPTICCNGWMSALNSIEMVDRSDDKNPMTKTFAQILTIVIRGQLGKFCPTCGSKL